MSKVEDPKSTALYLKALKAVAKGYRSSTGQKRVPAADRKTAQLHAKWASESPVYQAAVAKRRLAMPSKDVIEKASGRFALKTLVRNYRSGWSRKKVAPEHRESILSSAKTLASGDTFIPARLRDQISAAKAQHKRIPLALVEGEWYIVNKVLRDGDKPYFIGLGIGYGITRFVVLSDGGIDSAVEAALDKWPKHFFSEIKSKPPKNQDEERYHYIDSLGKWGIPEEDIRILKAAKQFVSNATEIDSNLFRLPDGRIVEAR